MKSIYFWMSRVYVIIGAFCIVTASQAQQAKKLGNDIQNQQLIEEFNKQLGGGIDGGDHIFDSLINMGTPTSPEGYPPVWDLPTNTESITGIIVDSSANPNVNGIPLEKNDYIGCFFVNNDGEHQCGGAIYWPDTLSAIFVIFGDDNSTPEKEGFSYGEEINYKLYSWSRMASYDVDDITLDPAYSMINKWYPFGLVKLTQMDCNEELLIQTTSEHEYYCNESLVSMDVEIIDGSDDLSYSWTSNPPGFTSSIKNPQFLLDQTTILTVVATDGVNHSNSSREINISYDPQIIAGENVDTCGLDIFALNGIANNVSSVLWTSTGDGTFEDSSSVVTNYYFGAEDYIRSSLTFSLTGEPQTPCTMAATDEMEVLLYPSPIVDMPANINTCVNIPIDLEATGINISEVQWETAGNGVFSDPNSLSTTYTLGSYGQSRDSVLLSLTATGIDPCNISKTYETFLVVNKIAFCSAGADATICGNETFETCGAVSNPNTIEWMTNGDGTFDDKTLLNATYTPGPEDISDGHVRLIILVTSIPPCVGTKFDRVDLFINDAPSVDAGSDVGTCGDPIVPLSATADGYSSLEWTTDGDGTFGNPQSLTTTYFAGDNDLSLGTVHLSLTAQPISPCTQPSIDNVNVNFAGGATADAGQDITVCSNQNIVLEGSASGYISVEWTTAGDGTFNSPNALNTQYFPGQNDLLNHEVILTLTPAGPPPCTFGLSDDMKLTVFSPATLSEINTEIITCEGLVIPLSTTATNYNSLEWTTSGDGSFSSSNSPTTNYTPGNIDRANGNVQLSVSVSSISPCIGNVSKDVEVLISTNPLANAGSDASLCQGNSYLVSGVAQNANGVQWLTQGDGYFDNANSAETTYHPGSMDIQLGETTLTFIANPQQPCTFISEDELVLTLLSNPICSAGNDQLVCEGEIINLNGSVQNAGSLLWETTGDGTFFDANSVSTTYYPGLSDIQNGEVSVSLKVFPVSPCVLTHEDQVLLTITQKPQAFAGIDVTVCENGFLQLSGSADKFDDFSWTSDGDGSFENASDLSTIYYPGPQDRATRVAEICLNVSGNAPCSIASDCLEVFFQSLPDVTAGPDEAVPYGSSFFTHLAEAYFESDVLWTIEIGSGELSDPNFVKTYYTPSEEDFNRGSVTLKITANPITPCVLSASDELILGVFEGCQDAIASAGNDLDICIEQNTVVPIFSAQANHYSSLMWTTNGDGFFTNQTLLNPVYLPGLQDIENGTVELCLTATAFDDCQNASDCMTVNFYTQPAADAGLDQTVCIGNAISLSGFIDNSTGSIWSTTGDGTFDNELSLVTEYFPGSNDILNGTVDLCLTAHAYANCLSAENCMTVSITTLVPMADAGENISICQGNSAILSGTAQNHSSFVWQSSGDGTFSDFDKLYTTYTPGSLDLQQGSVSICLLVTGMNGCQDVSDCIEINIISQPVANAGQDENICAGESFMVSGSAENYTSILWSTSGDGIFDDKTALKPIYTPGSQDINNRMVELCMSASGFEDCEIATACMNLTITPVPVVSAGSDISACEGQEIVLNGSASSYSNIVWSTNGDGTFANPDNLNASYFPGIGDILNQSVQLCLKANGNGSCQSVIDCLDIFIIINPEVSAGADFSICEGETVILNGIAENYESIEWQTYGNGTFGDPLSLSTTYVPCAESILMGYADLYLIARAENGCGIVQDFIHITIQKTPKVFPGDDQTICSNSTLSLSATVDNFSSVLWTTTGSGTFSSAENVSTEYFPTPEDIQNESISICLTGYGINGCDNTTECINATFEQEVVVDAGDDLTICEGDEIDLFANVENYTNISWSSEGDGEFGNGTNVSSSYLPGPEDIEAGTIEICMEVSGGEYCETVTDCMLLTIQKNPTLSAGNDNSIIKGNTFTTSQAEAQDAAAVLWQTSGSGTFDDDTQISSTYYPSNQDEDNLGVTLTLYAMPVSPCVLEPMDEMFLSILEDCADAIADAGEDITSCTSEAIALEATAQNQTGVVWTTNGDGSFANANSLSGLYFPGTTDLASGIVELCITAFAEGDCNDASDCMTISFFDAPLVNAGSDITTCDTESFVVLSAEVENGSDFTWTTSGSGNFIPPTSLSPKYFLSALDKLNGSVEITLQASNAECEVVSDNLTLTVNASPIVWAGSDATICGNEPFLMDAFAANYSSLLWSTDGDGTFDDKEILASTYYPGEQDIVEGSVELCLNANAAEGCEDDSDCFDLTLNPSAYANAGNDQTVCESDPVQLIGQASNFESVQWETSGDGTFENPSELIANYFPGSSDISEASVLLILTTYSSTGCGDDSDELWISIDGATQVSAGNDQSICQTEVVELNGGAINSSSVMWTTNGDGYFDDKTIGNATYIPGPGDINLGMVSLCLNAYTDGSCENASDCVEISIEPAPVANAGIDQTICQTATLALNGQAENYASVLWQTSGDGNFSNPTTLNPLYTPGENDITQGTVSLTLYVNSSTLCAGTSDNVMIYIEHSPVADAGNDQTICETSTVSLIANAENSASVNWTSSGDGVFENANTENTTYTPGTNDIALGSVALCLNVTASGSCQNTSDCMELTIEKMPEVDAGDDDVVCQSDPYQLSGSANLYSSVLWSSMGDGTFENPETLNALYTPGPNDQVNGSVELCLSAQAQQECTINSDCLVLSIQKLPVAYAGGDATLEGAYSFAITQAQADNASETLWQTSGTGTFDDASALSAIYTPTSTDFKTQVVTLSLTAFAINPCTTSHTDEMQLTLLPPGGCFDATAFAGEDATICADNSLMLSGQATDYDTIFWTTSGNGSFDDPNQLQTQYWPSNEDIDAGMITLCMNASAIDSCQDAQDCMTLFFQQQPFVFAGSDNTIPQGEVYHVMDSYAEHGSSIQWFTLNGLGSFDNETLLHTTYYPSPFDFYQGSVDLAVVLSAIDPCYVDIQDMMTLHFSEECNDAFADAGEDISLCQGNAFNEIYLEQASASNFKSLLWSTNGDGTFNYNTIVNPVYTPGANDKITGNVELVLSVEGFDPCASATDEIVIFTLPAPTANAGFDMTLCGRDGFPIFASATDYSSVFWTTSGDGVFIEGSSLNPIYIPGNEDMNNGIVELCLEANGIGQCISTIDCMSATLIEIPVVDAGEDAAICSGNNYQLNGSALSFESLQWSSLGDGTFTDASILNPVYLPGDLDKENGAVELRLTAFGFEECTDLTSFMQLSIINQPEAFAGNDATIIDEENYNTIDATALNASEILWETSGSGTFDDISQLQTTYYPSTQDIEAMGVSLTLYALPLEPCTIEHNDVIFLTIFGGCDDAIAFAGDDITTCSTEAIALEASVQYQTNVVWNTSGDGTFGNNANTSTLYYPGVDDISSGFAEICITAFAFDDCNDASDCLAISIFDAPVVDAGDDILTCDDEAFVVLQGVADKYTAIQWSSNGSGYFVPSASLTPKYFMSALDKQLGSVEITLTAGNANCEDVSDKLTLTINTSPIVYAGEDATICGNESFTTFEAFAMDYASILWSTDGDGTFDDTDILATSYYPGAQDIAVGNVELCLTALAAEACEDMLDCFSLTLNPSAFANAGEAQTICESETAQLNASAADYESVLWETSGDGSFENSQLISTEYIPGPMDILNNQVMLSLTAFSSTSCGDASSELVLSIDRMPQADAGLNQSICQAETVELIGSAQNFSSVMWTTDGDGYFEDVANVNTRYIPGANDISLGTVSLCLNAYADGSCDDVADCLDLSIELSPVADAGNDQTLCETETVALFGEAENFASVLWQTSGDGTFENADVLITNYIPGNGDIENGFVDLSLTANGTSLCADAIDGLTIQIDRMPQADAGLNQSICQTETVELIGSAQNFSSVMWTTNGDGSFEDVANVNTRYIPGANDISLGTVSLCLNAYADGSCDDAADCLQVNIIPLPVANAGNDTSINEDDNFSTNAATALNASEILWESLGDGTFANASQLSTYYYPGTEDIANLSFTLKLFTMPLESCTLGDDDEIVVTMIEVCEDATANAGEDITTCSTGAIALDASLENVSGVLWSTSGDGTFENESGSSTFYFPGADDINSGTVELCVNAFAFDDCNDASDCLTISIFDAPVVHVGDDIITCETESFVLLDAEIENSSNFSWATSGSGYFVPSNSLSPKYFMSALDKLLGVIEITLTAGNDNCEDASDNLTLTINTLPTVYAGEDVAICGNEQYTTFDAVAYDYSTLLWSSDGDGTFDDKEILAATYYPGSNDIINGNVQLCLTAQAQGNCDDVSDCFSLTLNSSAYANTNELQTICESETAQISAQAADHESVLWETSGDGIFANPNSLSTEYIPGILDIQNHQAILTFTAFSSTGCGDAISEMVLNIENMPMANAGLNQTICQTEAVELSGSAENFSSILWTSEGDGYFEDKLVENTRYIPGATDISSGVVTLCLNAYTDGSCDDVVDCMEVSIELMPTVYAGFDQTICETETVALNGEAENFAFVLWQTSGDGSFENAGALITNYIPGSADILNGVVELKLTATPSGVCSSSTDFTNIFIEHAPWVDAGADKTICETATLQLNAEAFNYSSLNWITDGDGTFDLSTTLTPVYYPGVNDRINKSVNLCLTASGIDQCDPVDDCMELYLQGVPEISMPENFMICEGENASLTATVQEFETLTWITDGDGTFENADESTAVYFPGPMDVENETVNICLKATGLFGCAEHSVCMILEIQKLPEVFSGDDLSVCDNESVTLNAVVTDYEALQWYSSGDGTFTNPNELAGQYVPGSDDISLGHIELCLSATGKNACSASQDCFEVTVKAAPTVDAGMDETLCIGQQLSLSGSITNTESVLWTTSGDGTFEKSSELTTVYYPGTDDYLNLSVEICLIATGHSVCGPVTDCKTVTFQADAVAIAGDDRSICQGQLVHLTGSASNYSSIYWTSSGTGNFTNPQVLNPTYTPSTVDIENGTVTLCLVAKGINDCSNTSDCLTLTLHQTPSVVAGNDITICEDQQAVLSATAENYSSILWTSAGDGTFENPEDLNTLYFPGANDIQNNTAINLCLYVDGISPCSDASDCLTLNVSNYPEIVFTENQIGCLGESIDLTADVTNYNWVAWSTNGDGTFDDATLLQARYYPGPMDNNNLLVEVCLSANGNTSCASITECMEISILPPPDAYAGVNDSVNVGEEFELSQAWATNYTEVLWTSSGLGTFDNSSLINATYTPSNYDSELDVVVLKLEAIQGSPCDLTAVDSILLKVNGNDCFDAEANAGEDQSICEGFAFTPTNASVYFAESYRWETHGDGTFDDPNLMHPEYTPGDSDVEKGHVVLELRANANGECDDDSDTLNLFIQSNPVVFAGGDNSLPYGIGYTISDAYTESSQSVQWTTINGMGMFSNETLINTTYYPSPFDRVQEAIILSVVASPHSPCNVSTNSVVNVAITDSCINAVVDAGENTGICMTDTTVQLVASAVGHSELWWTTSGDGTFNHPNTISPEYKLGANDRASDAFTLYLHANAFGACSSAYDSVVVSKIAVAEAYAGPDQTICEGTLCLITEATAANYSTIEWLTSGDGTFSDINALESSYTPGVEDINLGMAQLTLAAKSISPCEYSGQHTMTLVINSLPVLISDIEDGMALYGTSVSFTVNAEYAQAYQWFDAFGKIENAVHETLTLHDVSPTDGGIYYCELSNECGTTMSNTATLLVYEHQLVQIPQGWSGLSSYIEPNDTSLEQIFAPYNDDLTIIKNFGGVYYPALNVNTLNSWNSKSGYEVNFVNPVTFEMRGSTSTDRNLTVSEGWFYLPVISECPVEIESIFAGHESKIEIIKEIAGVGMYWPSMGINTIGELQPGLAYCMKSNEAFDITFEPCVSMKALHVSVASRPDNNSPWNDLHYSPLTHSIAFGQDIIEGLDFGDIIGAFTTDGLCAGYHQISSGENAITLFGDDPLTPVVDGFIEGEEIHFKVYSLSKGSEQILNVEFDSSYPSSDGLFVAHGISKLIKSSASSVEQNNSEFETINVYPNPSMGEVFVSGLKAGSYVEVWSTEGQLLMKRNFESENHDAMKINISGHPSGVLYFRIYSETSIQVKKIILK